jgi:hypothetical protein
VNPWLIAAVAAGALWLLFGRGQALPQAATSDNTVPLTDARGASGGGTSATVLPPGTLSQSGGSADAALVQTFQADPVGGDGSTQTSYPGTTTNPYAGLAAPLGQGGPPQVYVASGTLNGNPVTPTVPLSTSGATGAGGGVARHAGDISS